MYPRPWGVGMSGWDVRAGSLGYNPDAEVERALGVVGPVLAAAFCLGFSHLPGLDAVHPEEPGPLSLAQGARPKRFNPKESVAGGGR